MHNKIIIKIYKNFSSQNSVTFWPLYENLMNESSLPPIFAVTEPTSIDNNESNDFDPSLMQSFRDDILSSFDSIAPRLTQLERAYSKAINASQNQRDRSNFSFGDELNEVQRNMKEMHTQAIEMSRRVQSLTLSSQSSSALAAPRLLRPVNENFCDFKSEFDSSLKNLATLSGRITEKSQTISSSIDSVRKLPTMIENMKTNISSYQQKVKQNDKAINELNEKASQLIDESERNICKDIENQITDAENMLKEMEDSAQKGQIEADNFAKRIQDDKESLRLSFISLTQDIEKITNERLNELNADIEASTRKSNSLIESIQNQLSDEFDQIMKNESCESEISILDQLDQARQEAQLLSLMNRLEKLQKQIQDYDESIKNDDVIIEEEEIEEDENTEDEEIFTKFVNGTTIKYYCKSDGTFHT